MSIVIHNSKDTILIDKRNLEELKLLAKESPNKRARICLHKENNSIIHEMIIALGKDSIIKPHRHSDKSESYHIIEGELKIVLFDDDGTQTNTILLSSKQNEFPFIFRISRNLWHTVIPQTDYVIIHEVTKGPFNENSTEYADWSF